MGTNTAAGFPSAAVSTATEISFAVPGSGGETVSVDLAIFDAGGPLVRTLVSGDLQPGRHAVTWDGRDRSGNAVPNGTYFSRLLVADRTFKEQIVVAR